MKLSDLLANLPTIEGVSSKQARAVLEAYGQTVVGALEIGEDVPLLGVGVIKSQDVAARKGRNPKTGVEIDIAAKRTGKLVLSSGVKQHLNP